MGFCPMSFGTEDRVDRRLGSGNRDVSPQPTWPALVSIFTRARSSLVEGDRDRGTEGPLEFALGVKSGHR
ncbi:MAG: hypothetical protein Ct9H300mP1_03110 [Planctomycetaceae bacterium]|nr:MAG: hypothetical protein Ct9H300mP1_03110 [Planctomycetaceae bacterium]